MRGGVERRGVALAARHKRRAGHRTGYHAQNTCARRRRAFAVDDDVASAVAFLPREVVMVFDVQQHACAEMPRDVFVDEEVIRGGVFAHQFHRRPVFPAVGGVEVEPRKIAEFLWQILVLLARNAAVMVANLRAGAAAGRA